MQPRTVDELTSIADEIEVGLEKCKDNLNLAGGLSIKVRSFSNMILKADLPKHDTEILDRRANIFSKKIQELSRRKAAERMELEQDMEDSKIKVSRITELKDLNQDVGREDFFDHQTSRLDDFLMSTMGSIDSLKRQSAYIDRISSRMRSGLARLGIGNEVIQKINERVGSDKLIFIVLTVLVLMFIFILRFLL